MNSFIDEINYDKLIERCLKNVVVESLKIAERQGLPGQNHFYITFKTDYPEVVISNELRIQYPEQMTIVVQHQYSNLIVFDDSFSIELSFGGRLQSMHIPFNAITYFADPYAKFGLSFGNEDDAMLLDDMQIEQKVSGESAQIISFDSFRKP